MTSEQSKAEAYVRSQIPELAGVDSGRPEGSGYMDFPDIHLQHWLRVLSKYDNPLHEISFGIKSGTFIIWDCTASPTEREYTINFDMTTGQPATEADYKAFNEVVGI